MSTLRVSTISFLTAGVTFLSFKHFNVEEVQTVGIYTNIYNNYNERCYRYTGLAVDEAVLLLLGVPQTVSSLLGVGVTIVELL